MVQVRSQEEAQQVAEAYGVELISFNGYSLALLKLSGDIPEEVLFVLSAREDVPLPVLERNRRLKQYY